jgi:hypothetical protein
MLKYIFLMAWLRLRSDRSKLINTLIINEYCEISANLLEKLTL